MRIALISATRNGALLAENLGCKLPYEVTIYEKNGRQGDTCQAQSYRQLGLLIKDIFRKFDGFIFIMATGIVVRVIAPLLQDKRIDPAVVVMDERGLFAISLLSGHIGGANELARLAAYAVEAQAVITTATDVNQLPAVDVLAVKMGAKLEPFGNVKLINADIVNGDDVKFFFDKSVVKRYQQVAVDLGVKIYSLADIMGQTYSAAVLVTDKIIETNKPHIFVRPATLTVGVGCRRGTRCEEILQAIAECCQQAKVSMDSIAQVASTTAKEKEQGLLQAAEHLGVNIVFYRNQELIECIRQYKLSVSDFVQQTIGVGNVCEAAAMMGATKTLIKYKTKFSGITVAIARENYG